MVLGAPSSESRSIEADTRFQSCFCVCPSQCVAILAQAFVLRLFRVSCAPSAVAVMLMIEDWSLHPHQGAPGDVRHVKPHIPLNAMMMSTKPERSFTMATVERFVLSMAGWSLEREARVIVELSFKRPGFLFAVMSRRMEHARNGAAVQRRIDKRNYNRLRQQLNRRLDPLPPRPKAMAKAGARIRGLVRAPVPPPAPLALLDVQEEDNE